MRLLRVVERREETAGIASFLLEAADGPALPAAPPGAHLEFQLPAGLSRAYSLCGAPEDAGRWRIAVQREHGGRGGSRWWHEAVTPGAVIAAAGPNDRFPLDLDAPFSLLMAGGIGLTPLVAMAEALAARGRDFALHVSVRSRSRLAFATRLAQPRFAGRVTVHADDERGGQPPDLPALLARRPAGARLYVCGPAGFMDAVRQAARACGWPEDALRWEAFAAGPAAGDRPFRLLLARSGRAVDVPAGRSAAQALQDAGIGLPTSCEQGVCGTCLTPVLAGEVDHRDLFLAPAEQAAHDRFLPCCSRARGPQLTVDL